MYRNMNVRSNFVRRESRTWQTKWPTMCWPRVDRIATHSIIAIGRVEIISPRTRHRLDSKIKLVSSVAIEMFHQDRWTALRIASGCRCTVDCWNGGSRKTNNPARWLTRSGSCPRFSCVTGSSSHLDAVLSFFFFFFFFFFFVVRIHFLG